MLVGAMVRQVAERRADRHGPVGRGAPHVASRMGWRLRGLIGIGESPRGAPVA